MRAACVRRAVSEMCHKARPHHPFWHSIHAGTCVDAAALDQAPGSRSRASQVQVVQREILHGEKARKSGPEWVGRVCWRAGQLWEGHIHTHTHPGHMVCYAASTDLSSPRGVADAYPDVRR